MAEAKRKGMRLGRPAIALQKSADIRKLFYEEQLSKKEIARRLKVSRPSVIRILSRAA
jgi:DNA-binding transcriptional regulator LsrR (DeoR family)